MRAETDCFIVGGEQARDGIAVGALIMLGTLFGLLALIFALVRRYDPEMRGPAEDTGPADE